MKLFLVSFFVSLQYSSSIPLFSVDTHNQSIVNDPKVFGNFSISGGGEIFSEGHLGIELRGSSSFLFDKKSYSFETRDSTNTDLDVSMLELPKEEDWILNGPYGDKTLVRNVLNYDLSREMGRYASRTRFVELNINGEYEGIYVLMEKLKRDKKRINISKGDGYILKVDRDESKQGNFTDENSFVSKFGSDLTGNASGNSVDVHYLYDYPKVTDISRSQKDYISNYVNDFEIALAADDFIHPTNGKGYEEYIDVDSFIDFIILDEISKNIDGYRLSTYMSKDYGEKLTMGPVWDFNLAFGNTVYCEADFVSGWGYDFNTVCAASEYSVPFWFPRLMEDPKFVAKFKVRWDELRKPCSETEACGILSEASIFGKIDYYVEELSPSIEKNFDRWPILGVKLELVPTPVIGQDYADEISILKNWISMRLQWMDQAISEMETETLETPETKETSETETPETPETQDTPESSNRSLEVIGGSMAGFVAFAVICSYTIYNIRKKKEVKQLRTIGVEEC